MGGYATDGVDYRQLASEAFTQARREAENLRVLAGRSPVWEELAARAALVGARFAEATAAAALATMRGQAATVVEVQLRSGSERGQLPPQVTMPVRAL